MVAQDFRQLTRQMYCEIWCAAKAGTLQDLPAEEQQIGKVLLEHEEEYGAHFEVADRSKGEG